MVNRSCALFDVGRREDCGSREIKTKSKQLRNEGARDSEGARLEVGTINFVTT